MAKEYKGAKLFKVKFYISSENIEFFKDRFNSNSVFYIWREQLDASTAKLIDLQTGQAGVFTIAIIDSKLSETFELDEFLHFGPLDNSWGYLKITELLSIRTIS